MMKYIFCILCFVIMLQNTVAAQEQSQFRVMNYDIFSNEKDVGDVTLKLSKSEHGHIIVEQSHIKVSSWWWNIDIITVLSEQFQQGIGLVKGDGKTVDEGTAYWTKIEAREKEYWADFAEIKKVTSREQQKFSGLSFAVAGRVSPNIKEILSLSEAIFTDRKAQTHGVKFPKDSFDTTWNNLPFFIQENASKPLPKKLNILDTENLEIIGVSVTDQGLESLMVGTKKIQARRLEFADGKFKPSLLWIKTDANSLPYLLRHTGEDEDGTFEIVLKPH